MSIIIKNLSFVYSPKTIFAKTALQDIDITINDGEYLGIIGHTGSGKSTFVQHLNGLIKLQQGSIHIDGIDLSRKYDYKKLRATVGMVFQYPEYQLFDETVEKDVGFGPRNLGLSTQEVAERVRTSIELVGLDFESIRSRSPFEISGGQKRRVALAGVIAMRPKILVLDEPTAGLDPRGKKNILELIRHIKKTTSATIIMISHNMDEISEEAERVIVFNEGKIAYDLAPSQLFEKEQELTAMGLDIPHAAKIANSIGVGDGIYKKQDLIDKVFAAYEGGTQ